MGDRLGTAGVVGFCILTFVCFQNISQRAVKAQKYENCSLKSSLIITKPRRENFLFVIATVLQLIPAFVIVMALQATEVCDDGYLQTVIV